MQILHKAGSIGVSFLGLFLMLVIANLGLRFTLRDCVEESYKKSGEHSAKGRFQRYWEKRSGAVLGLLVAACCYAMIASVFARSIVALPWPDPPGPSNPPSSSVWYGLVGVVALVLYLGKVGSLKADFIHYRETRTSASGSRVPGEGRSVLRTPTTSPDGFAGTWSKTALRCSE